MILKLNIFQNENTNNLMNYTIYTLADPRSEEVRYVGYTQFSPEKRLRQHLNECNRSNNTHKLNWLRTLLREGLEPTINVIKVLDNKEDAYYLEQEYISKYDNLTNTTDGGMGASGLKHSDETRKLLSKKSKEHWDAMTPEEQEHSIQKLTEKNKGNQYSKGRKDTPELLERKRISFTGKNNPNYVAPVLQYTLDWEFVAEYETTEEAGKAVGCGYKNIHKAIKEKTKAGKPRIAKGYYWTYKT